MTLLKVSNFFKKIGGADGETPPVSYFSKK
jgi:hypothetical protein